MRLRELSTLQYQNISKSSHLYKLWLSEISFKSQIEHLSLNRFHCLSTDEAIQFMEGESIPLKGRPISLTFDNGYQDFYENALPVLSHFHLPATVLISPRKVGRHTFFGTQRVDYLGWNTLRELIDNGITIGAYEDDSWNINEIPQDTVESHIKNYKKLLEDKLGVAIRFFGVKEGVPTRKIRDLLTTEGYRAFLTQCPTNQRPDLYSIGRIQVDDDDFNIFLTKISKSYLFFKDKKSWKYIREYRLDRVAHRISEAVERIRSSILKSEK